MTRLMRSLAQLLGPSDSSVPRDDRHCPLTPGKVIWTQAGQGHGSPLGALIITAPLYTTRAKGHLKGRKRWPPLLIF